MKKENFFEELKEIIRQTEKELKKKEEYNKLLKAVIKNQKEYPNVIVLG